MYDWAAFRGGWGRGALAHSPSLLESQHTIDEKHTNFYAVHALVQIKNTISALSAIDVRQLFMLLKQCSS